MLVDIADTHFVRRYTPLISFEYSTSSRDSTAQDERLRASNISDVAIAKRLSFSRDLYGLCSPTMSQCDDQWATTSPARDNILSRDGDMRQWMQNRANVSICINNVLKDLHWKERECKNAKGEKLFQDVRVRATLMI